jgi:hypothetical protein
MTEAEASKALTGMGLTRKMAAYLLGQAKKYGAGAHLKCEVTYAADLGYVIVDYPAARNGGRRVIPGTANG